jgi:hypothetical protein
MQKSRFGSQMRTPAFTPRREPRSTEHCDLHRAASRRRTLPPAGSALVPASSDRIWRGGGSVKIRCWHLLSRCLGLGSIYRIAQEQEPLHRRYVLSSVALVWKAMRAASRSRVSGSRNIGGSRSLG